VTQNRWSIPEIELRQRLSQQLESDGIDILATIIDVEGNAYRRPGAKMLLTADGDGVGNVTAGCLENELLKVSNRIRDTGQAEVATYNLMDDEDDVWGLGVGCDGIIDVLLEPLTERYRPMTEALADGQDIASVVVLEDSACPLSLGDRAYVDPVRGELSPADGTVAAWPTALVDSATTLATTGHGDTVEIVVDDRELTVFIDGLPAPSDLIVFGTGHDVGPVVELASKNDFRVTVVGFRGGIDTDERFPQADRVLTTSPGNLSEDVDLTERTYAVVMTHNFVDDRLTIKQLLDSPVPYVGLMGPEERFEEMLESFGAEGVSIDESALDRLYTPIGLDLGGGSPYQIAHSIVAEVLAVSNDRDPTHLRARNGPIHDRIEVEIRNTETAGSD